MERYTSDVQYFEHCDKFLPRRTVYSHNILLKPNQKRKSNNTSIDHDSKCRLRCIESSDEECESNIADTPLDSPRMSDVECLEGTFEEIEDLSDKTNVDQESCDEQIWEDESEEVVDRDIFDKSSQHQDDNAQGQIQDPSTQNKVKSIISWILCSVLFLQCTYSMSNNFVEHILLLIHQILSVLGTFNVVCASIAKNSMNRINRTRSSFPVTVYMLRKWNGFDRDDFSKYIVCPNCMAIYTYDDIVKRVGDTYIIQTCSNKMFGCRVSKNSENEGSGKKKCYPLKVFCYKHISDSLELLLKRTDFVDNCNRYRDRVITENLHGDVFDGDIWKKIMSYKGEPFLSQPYNFAMMMNVDWFQPFKRRRDLSVGVIYLVFMNLPRNLRFKVEHMILVGIIQSLKTEPNSLNSFLKPIVKELKSLENGLQFKPCGKKNPFTCKMLLLCASSDIPAARKLCGFMGHSATSGCSFCNIIFVDQEGNRYCGRYHSERWAPRTRREHVKFAEQAEKSPNITWQKEIRKMSGYKFTKLLELQYFEPSIFSVVEPMHNLFLGTPKRLFNYWVDNDILSNANLQAVIENIEDLKISPDIGRLPSNIATNYGQFTADEWKNWVLFYSLIALHDILPIEHLKTLQTFVLACHHICKTNSP